VGSNGAGAAIIDARKLGRAFVDHGLGPAALQAYEDEMLPLTSKVILTNRVAGPDQILDVVEERCGGRFAQIDEVISREELATHAERYKAIAGYAIAATNEAPATIPQGARLS
jgi:2-polyprenyl-6-methoxyphenol hydroxylase-like FAD-dependent oxidoreductase